MCRIIGFVIKQTQYSFDNKIENVCETSRSVLSPQKARQERYKLLHHRVVVASIIARNAKHLFRISKSGESEIKSMLTLS
jgi:hypothetical protein